MVEFKSLIKTGAGKISGVVERRNLKQRITLIAVFTLLICVFTALFMPRTAFEYIDNTGGVVDAGEIIIDRDVFQEISMREGEIKSIQIDFNTYNRINMAEYFVELLDENGGPLLDENGNPYAPNVFNADKVQMGEPYGLPLPHIKTGEGDTYVLHIYTNQAVPGNALGVNINVSTKNLNDPAVIGGGEMAGSLRVQVGYESWSPQAWIIAAILIAAVALAILFWSDKLHVNVLVLALIFGVMFALLTPVLDTPDEGQHTATAFLLADGNFLADSVEGADYTESYNIVTQNSLQTLTSNTMGGVEVSAQDMHTAWGTGKFFLGFLPQTLGLWIGKLFRFDLMGYFYIGRVLNAVVYALCAYFAVKLAPKFKLYMAVLAIMPMSLMIAGSYNPDGLTYGLALLVGAKFIDMFFNRQYLISWRDIIIFMLMTTLLVMNKYTLAMLALLTFFIPASRFKDKKTKWLGACAILVVAAAATLGVLSWELGGSGGTSALTGTEVNIQGANAGAQLAWIIGNPGSAVSIFTKSIMRDIGGNLMQLFSLGQLTYEVFDIFAIIYFAFLAVVAFSYTRYEYRPELTNNNISAPLLSRGLMLIVIILTVFFTYMALYLTWTPLYADTVMGVQGRYFVGLFFLLPLLGQNITPLVPEASYYRAHNNIQFVAVLIAGVTLMTTVLAYY